MQYICEEEESVLTDLVEREPPELPLVGVRGALVEVARVVVVVARLLGQHQHLVFVDPYGALHLGAEHLDCGGDGGGGGAGIGGAAGVGRTTGCGGSLAEAST